MIHAAYDVLSSPDRRRSYDAQLALEAAEADAELKSTLDVQPIAGTRYVQDVPHRAALRVHVARGLTATGSIPVYGRRESFFSRLQTAMRSAAVSHPGRMPRRTHSVRPVPPGLAAPRPADPRRAR
jgi:curved DNA-binding protein CbpA